MLLFAENKGDINLDTWAFSRFLAPPSEKLAPPPAIEPATSSSAAESKRTKLEFAKCGKGYQSCSVRRKQPPISSQHQSWHVSHLWLDESIDASCQGAPVHFLDSLSEQWYDGWPRLFIFLFEVFMYKKLFFL